MSSKAFQVKADLGSVVYRRPSAADGQGIHGLIRSCPPLDLNSSYAYLLLGAHFADTCVIATEKQETLGFLSAYRKPETPDVLFVWQVAVAPQARGRGVASRLLAELISRSSCSAVRAVETTIGPSNRSSWALFESFAQKLGAPYARGTLFHEEDFGDEGHEEEQLLRIGPIDPKLRGELCKSLTS